MKYLKSYNEGIISSAVELINRSRKNDEIAQKYLKMIYDDWNKNKDLYRISIIKNSDNVSARYLFYLYES